MPRRHQNGIGIYLGTHSSFRGRLGSVFSKFGVDVVAVLGLWGLVFVV